MFVVANAAILTQLFTVKHKHVSTSVCEQSQPALEAGNRRDNIADAEFQMLGKLWSIAILFKNIGVC